MNTRTRTGLIGATAALLLLTGCAGEPAPADTDPADTSASQSGEATTPPANGAGSDPEVEGACTVAIDGVQAFWTESPLEMTSTEESSNAEIAAELLDYQRTVQAGFDEIATDIANADVLARFEAVGDALDQYIPLYEQVEAGTDPAQLQTDADSAQTAIEDADASFAELCGAPISTPTT